MAQVDQAVTDYIDQIAPEHRELFDRMHELILAAHPDVTVVLSYKMPTYRVGRRRLHLGAWQHGLSVYGWPQERGAEFAARHPGVQTSKGTIRLRPQDAAAIPDDELLGLIGAALGP